MQEDEVHFTCSAGVNIAVIKYWGKRDEKLILPINSSLSATLSQDDLCTTTSILASPRLTFDRLWLNGKEAPIDGDRTQAVLREIRARAGDVKKNGRVVIPAHKLRTYRVNIVSHNNFPTAAGLASSASGFATLVYCLAKVFQVEERYEGELSTLARQGSGSACRSLYGGWVKWVKGVREDGADSRAVQIVDENYWKEIEVLVCVVSDAQKDTSSTAGMKDSVETSELLKYRAEQCVERRCEELETALKRKDFDTFARLTMQDSNQFHAVCLDTQPPIFYLRSVSRRVIALISAINAWKGTNVCAYTFDAGPNAVLYLPRAYIPLVLQALLYFFPPGATPLNKYVNKAELLSAIGVHSVSDVEAIRIDEGLSKKLGKLHRKPDSLRYILHTTVGGSPRVLPEAQTLINPTTGLPKHAAL